jgi:hypothetical protein
MKIRPYPPRRLKLWRDVPRFLRNLAIQLVVITVVLAFLLTRPQSLVDGTFLSDTGRTIFTYLFAYALGFTVSWYLHRNPDPEPDPTDEDALLRQAINQDIHE